jgi:sporulation protein YlmC with PRC-barrel domain
MKFVKGADVFSSLGEKVGSIDRVVIDPKTDEVSHLVIKKGLLLAEKVVPIAWVRNTSDRLVTLKHTAKSFDDLPDF